MELVPAVNQILSILTIIGQAMIVALIVLFVTRQRKPLGFFAKYALVLSFIVALIATLGSLFYSEIAGYDPCKLCWLQRIFMYPQTILLGIAAFKKDWSVGIYGIVLSIIGAVIAGYHYLLQIGLVPSLSCGVTGYSSECSQRFVLQFGYITIPIMAFSAFLLIILLLMTTRFRNSQN